MKPNPPHTLVVRGRTLLVAQDPDNEQDAGNWKFKVQTSGATWSEAFDTFHQARVAARKFIERLDSFS